MRLPPDEPELLPHERLARDRQLAEDLGPLFAHAVPVATFDVSVPRGTFDQPCDEGRLSGQLARTRAILADGEWWTLPALREASRARYDAQDSEAGLSARIRDLRKAKFGGHRVEHRRRSDGLWEYRLLLRPEYRCVD